jgi:hypothetical protein
MRVALAFLFLLSPGLLRPGGLMPAAPSSTDALDRAETALMDGDFDRAASLASNASGPEAERLLGEALEAKGDLKGAAAAYADAAKDASGPAAGWLSGRAQGLQAAAQKQAEALEPSPLPTATPTAIPSPTAVATAVPTAVPTLVPTAAPTLMPSPQATPSPDLEAQQKALEDEKARQEMEKEKLELLRQRQQLEDDKAKLEQEKEALQKQPVAAAPNNSQGLTFYWGGGYYQAKVVTKVNDFVRQASQSSQSNNSGSAPQIQFPLNKAIGLRWDGFAVEGEFLDADLNYTGTGSQASNGQTDISIHLAMVSFGYDWAFIRRGTLLGPLELAIPLRLEFGQVEVDGGGLQNSSGFGGPASGLSLRCWVTPRFLMEAQALYHINPGGGHNGGDNGGNQGSGGGSGSNSNVSQSIDGLSDEGFEARLNLGWRFF